MTPLSTRDISPQSKAAAAVYLGAADHPDSEVAEATAHLRAVATRTDPVVHVKTADGRVVVVTYSEDGDNVVSAEASAAKASAADDLGNEASATAPDA